MLRQPIDNRASAVQFAQDYTPTGVQFTLCCIGESVLTLKCTKKVQDYLGLKGGDLSGATEPSSVLGAWYVNQFSVGRRKAFIFMSERTYLSFIMLDAKKSNSDVEMLPLICIRGIVQTLELHKATHDLIGRVVEDYQSVSYSRTDSAKVLGNLNDLVARYKWLIEDRGGIQHADVGAIIINMNSMPQRNLAWSNSAKVTLELLSAAAT